MLRSQSLWRLTTWSQILRRSSSLGWKWIYPAPAPPSVQRGSAVQTRIQPPHPLACLSLPFSSHFALCYYSQRWEEGVLGGCSPVPTPHRPYQFRTITFTTGPLAGVTGCEVKVGEASNGGYSYSLDAGLSHPWQVCFRNPPLQPIICLRTLIGGTLTPPRGSRDRRLLPS